MFQSWIFYIVLCIVSQIVFLQTFKYVAKDTKSIGALTVIVQIIGAAFVILLSPFLAWTWPSGDNWWMWLLLAISFILYAVNDRLDATTRKHLDITVDTMLHQTYRILFFPLLIVFGVLVGTFSPNSISWASLVGGIIIVIANMFLIFEKGKFRFNRYVLLKMVSVVFFTFAFTMQIFSVGGFNIAFFSFLSLGVPAVLLLSARQATPKSLYTEIKRKQWGLITVCGIAQGLQVFSIYMAMEFGDRMQVNATFAVYVLLNVVFAYIFLKERGGLVRKSIAAAVIVASMIMIALRPF
jgi:uncharacterized membrane protein